MLTNSEIIQSKTLEACQNFIHAVNGKNISQIVLSLSESTVFSNSQGKEIKGRDNVLRAWMKYFELFPDYYIDAENLIEDGNTIVILGYSGGNYKNMKKEDCQWRLPSAWKVKLEDSQITCWQVYTDNMVPFEIIKRNMSNGH